MRSVTVGDISLRTQLRELYRKLSPTVHGRQTVSEEEAKDAFNSTLKTVHSLYKRYNF